MKFRFSDLSTSILRPPGDGIPTFSAGGGAAFELQSRMYKLLFPNSATPVNDLLSNEQINSYWQQTLTWLPAAKVIVIGVPLDTGAGIRRGAAYGPRSIREELLRQEAYVELLKRKEVVDLGDLFVNPHLLHDEMLNENQIQLCQNEMYVGCSDLVRSRLPVSALSQLKVLLETVLDEFPHLKIQLLGGDHSVAWPMIEVLVDKYPNTLGIVQSDAHTDFLSSRLGVKYCFGTWSFHANSLLGCDGKLVQIGIRQSGKNQAHWEKFGVKQFWAHEILSQPADETISNIVRHLKSKGVRHLYISNDIDGTDQSEAPATGTPAADGLPSSFLFALIQELEQNFEIVAGDIVEVAPDLGRSFQEKKMTCELAARYVQSCLKAQINR